MSSKFLIFLLKKNITKEKLANFIIIRKFYVEIKSKVLSKQLCINLIKKEFSMKSGVWHGVL